MAHSLSAKKRVRQNEKRHAMNRSRMSALRTSLRACRDALASKDHSNVDEQFRLACRALDRAAGMGLIHRNAAARRKSRLSRRVAAAKAAPAK